MGSLSRFVHFFTEDGGEAKPSKGITDGTWARAYIGTSGANANKWAYYEDASSSIIVPITPNAKYHFWWDTTDKGVVGTMCRVGFAKADTLPENKKPIQLYSSDGTADLLNTASIQEAASLTFTLTDDSLNYMVIQISGSSAAWSDGDFTTLWKRIGHLHLDLV